MPYLGAHMSISGQPAMALRRGAAVGCRVIQFFSRNRVKWEAKELSGSEIDQFRRIREETSVIPVALHGSYLINLASDSADIRRKSLSLLKHELGWAAALDVPFLVLHPGSHKGDGLKKGLQRIIKALNQIHDQESQVKILLETTAGQGTNIGYLFEHLAEIITRVNQPQRLGICFDTCHVFSAGYDFRTKHAYRHLLSEFDKIIGLERLSLFHINDSKGKLGEKRDRHEHPGHGHIGLKAFSMLLNDPRFGQHSFLLETPKDVDLKGMDMDSINLKTLKNLIKAKTK
jgi:deoxyribonuclease-4